MSGKLKITKIELSTKEGKKVELSLEEAKDLHGQLDELFGQKAAPFIPYSPIIIDRTVRPYWPGYNPIWYSGVCGSAVPGGLGGAVTCSSNSGLSVSYCGSEA